MFTKFLNKQKEQGTSAFDSVSKPSATLDDSALCNMQAAQNEPRRRWSYVTYLDKGTLHGDDDNLMLGL